MQPGPGVPAAVLSADELARLFVGLVPNFERITRAHNVPAADAQDLIQDLALAALRNVHRIEKPREWLVAAMRKHCWLYWRAQHRRQWLVTRDPAVLPHLDRGHCPHQLVELRHDLSRALRTLKPKPRNLLLAAYVVGWPWGEAAARTGYRRGSVGRTLQRCFRELRRTAFGRESAR